MLPMMMAMGMMHGPGMALEPGIEVRYLPGLTPQTSKSSTNLVSGGLSGVVIGLDARHDMGLLGIGGQANMTVQLSQSSGSGSWVMPHLGIMPRFGLDLGPVRLDAGSLLGAGAALRQAQGATSLESRLLWMVEPRLELGFKAQGFRIGLVASYLVTPDAEFMGPSAGLRISFGGSNHVRGQDHTSGCL